MAGYRFQPQTQRPVLSVRPDVRGGEDPREIEMTRRETTSPEPRQTRHRLVSTMTCTVRPNHENDRQQPPNFSSLVLHTYTYTML